MVEVAATAAATMAKLDAAKNNLVCFFVFPFGLFAFGILSIPLSRLVVHIECHLLQSNGRTLDSQQFYNLVMIS